MKIKTWDLIVFILLLWGIYRSNTVYFDDKSLNKPINSNNHIEGFMVKKKHLRETPLEIYDKFYSKLYESINSIYYTTS